MSDDTDNRDVDPVEAAVKYAHIIIPIAGAVLIFMLAFIAVTMA